MAELRKSGRKFTFLVPGKAGSLASCGHSCSYKVIEDRSVSQIVEVRFRNTYASWSRYEAYDDRIVPISHRTDGSFYVFIPVFAVLLAAALFVARRVTRLLRQKLAVA